MSKFSRIGAITAHRPELPLIFLASRGKKSDGFGIRRPGRIGIEPLCCGFQIYPRSGRTTRRCLNVSLVRCGCGSGLEPRDMGAIGRKGNVTVEDGLAQLVREWRALRH